MAPFPAPFRFGKIQSVLALSVLTLLVSLACEEKQEEAAPTKPWLRDEAERKRDDSSLPIRFQIAPEASLSIALPTRHKKPVGTLSRIEGHVDFDLKELARSSGRIHVDLSALQMDNLPPPKKVEEPEEAPELYNDATGEALRWLGLGAGVSARERREHAVAVFHFESLRALSHKSASVGALTRSPTGGTTRQVFATAEGELSLRNFSVSRSFSTTLKFHFPTSEAKVPDSVEVTIRRGAVVPLAEYEIAPRGPDGNLDAKRAGLLGDVVGSQVRVTGSLLFTRARAAHETQKKTKITE